MVQGSDVISAMERLNKKARFQRVPAHCLIVTINVTLILDLRTWICHEVGLIVSNWQKPHSAIFCWRAFSSPNACQYGVPHVRRALAIWIAMWDRIVAIWDLGNFMQRCKRTPPCTVAMLQSIKPLYVMLQVRLCKRSAIEKGLKSRLPENCSY